MILTFLYIIF